MEGARAASSPAAAGGGENRMEVTVYLNPDFFKNPGDDAEDFVFWKAIEAAAAKNMNSTQAKNDFFKRVGDPNSGIKVIGINEFPYTDGGRLKGEDRLLEREYWIRDPTQEEYVVLHVHFAGKWLANHLRHLRDWSTILQANLRHSVTADKPTSRVFFRKCKDLSAWREEFGSEIKGISEGWKWRDQKHKHPQMHKLLLMGEACVRHVKAVPVVLPIEDAPQRCAFIVACGSYEHKDINDLPKVRQDAERLKRSLEHLGWAVDEILYDPTFRTAEHKFEEFCKRSEDMEDAILVCWTGHGFEYKGVQYMLTQNTKPPVQGPNLKAQLSKTCMNLNDMLRTIERYQLRCTPSFPPSVVVVDCCRTEVPGFDFGPTVFELKKGSESSVSIDNSIVIYSTSSGDTAGDGVFMECFVDHILKSDKDISLVLRDVRNQIGDGQLPPELCNLRSEFYFKPPALQDEIQEDILKGGGLAAAERSEVQEWLNGVDGLKDIGRASILSILEDKEIETVEVLAETWRDGELQELPDFKALTIGARKSFQKAIMKLSGEPSTPIAEAASPAASSPSPAAAVWKQGFESAQGQSASDVRGSITPPASGSTDGIAKKLETLAVTSGLQQENLKMPHHVSPGHTAVLCGLRGDIETKDVEKALKDLKMVPSVLPASGISAIKPDKSDMESSTDRKRHLVFLNCPDPSAAKKFCDQLNNKPCAALGMNKYGNILQAVLKKEISSLDWAGVTKAETRTVEGTISKKRRIECFLDAPLGVWVSRDVFEGSDSEWIELKVGSVLRVVAENEKYEVGDKADWRDWVAREAVYVRPDPRKQKSSGGGKQPGGGEGGVALQKAAEDRVMEEAEQMVTGVLVRKMKGQGWTSLATIGGWFNSPPETQEVKEALQIVKTKHKQLKNFVAACQDVAVREIEGKKGTFEILLAEDFMTYDVQMLKKKQENLMTASMFERKTAEMQKEMEAEMEAKLAAQLEKLKAAIPKGAESLEAQAIREGKQVVDISNGKKYAFSRENDLLGWGVQGMVFKATCLSDRSLIALKLVPLKKGTQIQDREHTNLEKLNHPNVVNLFGHCKTDAHLVLAMELVVGTAYDDYLKEKGGKVPWQEAKSDFLHIIKGMQAVHEKSIVHRDLKPANIMRRRNGWCVIVDFGLSKDSKVFLGTQSASGGFKGTKAYSAPELLISNGATPAVDVFSIGVMLYESVSGYLPWSSEEASTKSTERASCSVLGEGSSELDNMWYSINTAKVPPTALRPDEAPASINDFVLRCLAPVEKRFKSAGEMLKPWEDAIEAASEELAFWSMSFGNTEKSVPRDDLAKKFADKFSLTQQQADKLVGDMDADSSGGISPEEMINFFSGRIMAEKVAEYKLAAAPVGTSGGEAVVDCLKNALEIEGVKFQSKGTMLGGKKDRVGMLRLHKDEVIAFRIDGRDKISVYSFRVTVSKMERIAGKPEVFVGPDAGGKSRSFTFASEKDTDRFVNAFRSTKAALLEEF